MMMNQLLKEVVKNLKSNVRREIQNIYYIKKTPEPKRYDFISLLIYQVKYYFNIKKNFQKLQDKKIPNYIYINTLDHFDKALAIFGSPFSNISFSGLLCKCKFHLHSLKIGPFKIIDFDDYIEAMNKTDNNVETTIVVRRDKNEYKFFVTFQ